MTPMREFTGLALSAIPSRSELFSKAGIHFPACSEAVIDKQLPGYSIWQ
jgi:hypothetical protein